MRSAASRCAPSTLRWRALRRAGRAPPIACGVEPDDGDPGRYALTIAQDGLGMPDRDYYLSDAAPMRAVRGAYLVYLAATLRVAGVADADAAARDIVQLETRIATSSWTAAAGAGLPDRPRRRASARCRRGSEMVRDIDPADLVGHRAKHEGDRAAPD